jgi:ketosteroid isomerase-like protein
VSQENVEIVRGIYDDFARHDNNAPFTVYAPDVVWDLREAAVDVATVYHGHDGVRTAFRNWLAPFRDFKFLPNEMRASPDDVLVTVNEHGIGRASGVVVDRCHYALWTLRGGKVVSMRVYLDHAEALKAVGLEK